MYKFSLLPVKLHESSVAKPKLSFATNTGKQPNKKTNHILKSLVRIQCKKGPDPQHIFLSAQCHHPFPSLYSEPQLYSCPLVNPSTFPRGLLGKWSCHLISCRAYFKSLKPLGIFYQNATMNQSYHALFNKQKKTWFRCQIYFNPNLHEFLYLQEQAVRRNKLKSNWVLALWCCCCCSFRDVGARAFDVTALAVRNK